MSIEVVGKKLPLIEEGDDLIEIIQDKINKEEGEVLIVSETIISKSRGLDIELKEISPSKEAKKLATKTNKDPRVCELLLEEADKILGEGKGFIITERNGLVCANAGIDLSNAGKEKALLPLKNPQKTAKEISDSLDIPVIISDSVGRPFRKGATGLAKAYYGIKPFSSYIGKKDLFEKEMESTIECVVDELASAANLVLGESNRGVPIALIRGFKHNGEPIRGSLNRNREESIFR